MSAPPVDEVREALVDAYQDGSMTFTEKVADPVSVLGRAEVVVDEISGDYIATAKLGDDYDNISAQVTEAFDIVSYTEAHFTELPEQNGGHALIYQDGELLVDDFFSNAVSTASWSELNSCLSSAGIAAWLVAAAMVACSASGPGLVVCLIGAGIGAGTVGYCVRKAFG